MKIDGSCHCGQVTYEAEIDPQNVSICHCTDCQTLSGSAFRVSVAAPEEHFAITKGALKTYVKIAESGAERAQTFCPECGTPIYATSVGGGPKVFVIRTGTARQREQLVPTRQIWHRSALSWLDKISSLPAVEKGR